MASSRQKTRSRSVIPKVKVKIQRIELGPEIDPDRFIKSLSDLAWDEEIKYLKDKRELDLVGATLAGIAIGLVALWFVLVMLWAIHG